MSTIKERERTALVKAASQIRSLRERVSTLESELRTAMLALREKDAEMRSAESRHRTEHRSLQADFRDREAELQRRLELAEKRSAKAEDTLRRVAADETRYTGHRRRRVDMDECLDNELENMELEDNADEQNVSISRGTDMTSSSNAQSPPLIPPWVSTTSIRTVQEEELLTPNEPSVPLLTKTAKRTELVPCATPLPVVLPDLALLESDDDEDETSAGPARQDSPIVLPALDISTRLGQSEDEERAVEVTPTNSAESTAPSTSSQDLSSPIQQNRAWLPRHRKARTDEYSMQALARAINSSSTEKSPKLMRAKCLGHIRQSLNTQEDIDALVEALALVPYGTVVRFPPFKKRPNRRSHRVQPHPKRSRTEAKDASERWSAAHIIVEMIAWWGCQEVDKSVHCAEVLLRLASPARLGANTLTEFLRSTAKCAVSLEAWRLGLPEERVTQLNEALTFWHVGNKIEHWPTAARLLDTELRSRLGLSSSGLHISLDQRDEVIGRLGTPDGLNQARTIIHSILQAAQPTHGIDYRKLAEAAWLLVTVDPLDDLVARARTLLCSCLDSASFEAASALAASLNGIENDGSTAALLGWAQNTLSYKKENKPNVPTALLRKISSLQRRPLARFLNLAKAEDRRRAMARLGLVTNLALECIEAFDGTTVAIPTSRVALTWSDQARSLNAKFDTSSRGATAAYSTVQLSPSERGCAATHVELWRRAAQDQGPVLILEDDVVFAPHFNQRYTAALDALPDDVDILLLGYWSPGTEHCLENRSLSTLRRFLFLDYFWGLHAYVLTPRGARILLDNLPVDAPADVYVAKLVNTHRLVAAALKHKLVKQRTQNASSVVHTNREDAGVVYDKRKTAATALIYDHADTLSNRFW